MLARLLRRILAAELLLYSGIALGANAAYGTGLGGGIAIVLLLGLSARAAYVAGAYLLAGGAARPDPRHALGPVAAFRMGVTELGALIWTHTMVQPWWPLTSRLLPAAEPDNPELPPVLFVHGFCCNEGYWAITRRRLHRRGVTRQGGISLEPVFTDIDDYAAPLHEAVESLCEHYGVGDVIIVAHSMGGLAARSYLRRYGGSRVRQLITVGTPHRGTSLARYGMGTNSRQMEPDSPWLQHLNGNARRQTTAITAILSRHDELISPRENAVLPGAVNIHLEGVGHLTLGMCAATVGHIYRTVTEATASTSH